jgi:hypothetical protein
MENLDLTAHPLSPGNVNSPNTSSCSTIWPRYIKYPFMIGLCLQPYPRLTPSRVLSPGYGTASNKKLSQIVAAIASPSQQASGL